MESGTSKTESAARDVKERAGQMLEGAKDTARTKLNEQKDSAAQGIGELAGALHDAAHRTEGEGKGAEALSQLADSAAQGLDRLSGALRSRDVGSMLRDVESFARNQPVAFFGLALAAGFLAVRFVKSSND